VKDRVRSSPADRARVASIAAGTLPLLLLAAMGYARRWVAEDAFIVLRVVRHVLAGHGPVFNVAERVEAYTSPLWVALLAAAGALGVRLEVGAVVLGLACSVAGVLLAQMGAWRLGSRLAAGAREGRAEAVRLALPLGAAALAAIPAVWDFGTSGLESGLSIGWLGGAFWLLARMPAPPSLGLDLAAVFIGAGPLVRPDLGLFSAAFAAALAVIAATGPARRPAPWHWVRLGALVLALPAAYQVFRMGYFAAIVPNTALAKEAGAAHWRQGWRYTADLVGTYALWIPMLLVIPWAVALLRGAARTGNRPAAALLLAPVAGALAHWLFVTRVGGDFMHGRLLLPTLFGLLLPVASVIVPAGAGRAWRAATLAGVAGWAAVCALWLRPAYPGQIGPAGIADERGYYVRFSRTPHPVRIDAYLNHPLVGQFGRDLARVDRSVVLGETDTLTLAGPLAPARPPSIRIVVGVTHIGIAGYLAGSGVHLADRLGLADPVGSRLALTQRGRPGHEKLLPDAWIVARFGDPAGAAFRSTAVLEAGRALGCGDLARLLEAVESPLTWRRFLANVRAAWTLHRLRIPADATSARGQQCLAATHEGGAR
jgi:arabinofuranosyltransferase